MLSHQGSWRQRAGWRSRVGGHQPAVRKADRPGPGQYSLSRGLAGLAHHTVLGPELVAMLGEERLARLPAPRAERRGDGRWLLSTTDDPLGWTFERWCPEEAAVIEALGAEHFFDPETGQLPTLPPLAPYRCPHLELDTTNGSSTTRNSRRAPAGRPSSGAGIRTQNLTVNSRLLCR